MAPCFHIVTMDYNMAKIHNSTSSPILMRVPNVLEHFLKIKMGLNQKWKPRDYVMWAKKNPAMDRGSALNNL